MAHNSKLMLKNVVSIFFTFLFVSYLTAPLILKMVDESIDVSIVNTMSEEGEIGGEKIKDVEILFYEPIHNFEDVVYLSPKNVSDYYFKNYPKPHLNLVSPPPEYI